MAPSTSRTTIFNPLEIRSSWGAIAQDSWYIGPDWDHYRCLKFLVSTTGEIRVSGQYKLYPQHSRFPFEIPRGAYTRLAKDLIKSVKVLQDQETNHPGRHTHALKILTKIFSNTT